LYLLTSFVNKIGDSPYPLANFVQKPVPAKGRVFDYKIEHPSEVPPQAERRRALMKAALALF
jgi:hypothetical protein